VQPLDYDGQLERPRDLFVFRIGGGDFREFGDQLSIPSVASDRLHKVCG
jgi:hypothetical protein